MIDHMLHHFRRASRELFNQYFYQADPVQNRQAISSFAPVESRLFQALAELADLQDVVTYGIRQPNIAVRLDFHHDIEILLCHDYDSYDWQPHQVPRHENMRFSFIRYTDLHDSYDRDNRYVMAQVEHWPAHPEYVGALALICHEYAVYMDANAIRPDTAKIDADASIDPLELDEPTPPLG